MSNVILQAAGVVGGLLVAASSDSVAKSKLRESECAS
jgi:hypothetical protein